MTTAISIESRLDGRLLRAGDAGYDESRTVWNGMVDRRPRMIVRAASAGDVVTAVRTARELDLEGPQAYGGAIADVPDEDAAFSHRATLFEFGTGTNWTDPADDEHRIAAARRSTARARRQRQRPGRRGRGRCPPRLLAGEARPAGRAQGRLRPAQRVPPQPEHPTRLTETNPVIRPGPHGRHQSWGTRSMTERSWRCSTGRATNRNWSRCR